MWLDGGDKQDDVLVRVSCRMLSNGATIHIVLSDETPSPPLRVENRSSTQSLAYRVGGDAESNVRFLEPMRWNALHWINDDKRCVTRTLRAAVIHEQTRCTGMRFPLIHVEEVCAFVHLGFCTRRWHAFLWNTVYEAHPH